MVNVLSDTAGHKVSLLLHPFGLIILTVNYQTKQHILLMYFLMMELKWLRRISSKIF